MTMPHAEVVRKVKQLDDDVHGVYELIDNIRATQNEHTRRLDVLDAKVDGLDAKVDGLDGKVDGHTTKLDGHDVKLDRILQILESR